jgi:1-acyl-sn-glycerol-3-phosphate acyltransferase
MIIGENREAVIKNIKANAENGNFHGKVEINDPVLTTEEKKEITDSFVERRRTFPFRAKTRIAVAFADYMTSKINKTTRIVGAEKIPSDIKGFIITSNHFSPLENTVVRYLTASLGRHDLNIIAQVTNFAMTGPIGFLMNYARTIPISTEPHYLARDFMALMREKLVERGEVVLLYPEQEMWFNYRKPRPPKDGAYFFAAKLGVPIVSCFVEIDDLDEDETPEFKKTKYVLHVLDVLTPDPSRSLKENTEWLGKEDYRLKKECYENVYGRELDYIFDKADIAGWKGALS